MLGAVVPEQLRVHQAASPNCQGLGSLWNLAGGNLTESSQRWGACSGAVLTDVPKRMFPKRDLAAKLGQRLAPVFFTKEELRDVKAVKDPGAWLAHDPL